MVRQSVHAWANPTQHDRIRSAAAGQLPLVFGDHPDHGVHQRDHVASLKRIVDVDTRLLLEIALVEMSKKLVAASHDGIDRVAPRFQLIKLFLQDLCGRRPGLPRDVRLIFYAEVKECEQASLCSAWILQQSRGCKMKVDFG